MGNKGKLACIRISQPEIFTRHWFSEQVPVVWKSGVLQHLLRGWIGVSLPAFNRNYKMKHRPYVHFDMDDDPALKGCGGWGRKYSHPSDDPMFP